MANLPNIFLPNSNTPNQISLMTNLPSYYYLLSSISNIFLLNLPISYLVFCNLRLVLHLSRVADDNSESTQKVGSPPFKTLLREPIYLLSASFRIFLSYSQIPLSLSSIYLNARRSSHKLSCADKCFDLCLVLQYSATRHCRHLTSPRSSHPGQSQTWVSSLQKLSCSGRCCTAWSLQQYSVTRHPAHLLRTAPSLALTWHAGCSHCLTSLCLSFATLL